jgi:hypothetical protein
MTMTIWLTMAGHTRPSAGGSTTREDLPSFIARLRAASIWPRGVFSMPARTISAA